MNKFMEITRKSEYSGVIRTLDLNITQEQIDNYAAGALLQNAFPNLSKADREFFKSGITDEEWQEMFGLEDNMEEEEND
jgi:hypothetical protein